MKAELHVVEAEQMLFRVEETEEGQVIVEVEPGANN
jgi:hypothetical protein